MPKKMREMSRKRMVSELDRYVSLIVRLKDPYCVVCGSREKLTNGHVFSRRKYNTRWDIKETGNCHTQCWACNYKHVRDQYPYFDWYIKRFGMSRFERLRKRFNAEVKFSTPQLAEMLEKVKKQYTKLVERSYNDPFK